MDIDTPNARCYLAEVYRNDPRLKNNWFFCESSTQHATLTVPMVSWVRKSWI
ncbi:MAG: hypothetical protein ABSD56_01870 [Bryobacteraceae bacterium]